MLITSVAGQAAIDRFQNRNLPFTYHAKMKVRNWRRLVCERRTSEQKWNNGVGRVLQFHVQASSAYYVLRISILAISELEGAPLEWRSNVWVPRIGQQCRHGNVKLDTDATLYEEVLRMAMTECHDGTHCSELNQPSASLHMFCFLFRRKLQTLLSAEAFKSKPIICIS